MTCMTVEGALRAELERVQQRTEIRDPEGNLLGYFTPWAVAQQEHYQKAEALFDPEEMRRRNEMEHQGFTIEEVMRHLQSLEAR